VAPVNELRIPAINPSSKAQTDSSIAGRPEQSRSSPTVRVKSMQERKGDRFINPKNAVALS